MKQRFIFIFPLTLLLSCLQKPAQQPNILWITSEDNGPNLGAYGDTYATMPVLDKLGCLCRRYRIDEKEGP